MTSKTDDYYISACACFIISLLFDIAAIVLVWEGPYAVTAEPGYDAYWYVTSTIVYCIGMMSHLIALTQLMAMPSAHKKVQKRRTARPTKKQGPPMRLEPGSPRSAQCSPVASAMDSTENVSADTEDVLVMQELDAVEKANDPRVFARASAPDRNSLYVSCLGFLLHVAGLAMSGHLFTDSDVKLGSGFFCMLGSMVMSVLGLTFLSVLLHRRLPSGGEIAQSATFHVLLATIIAVCDVLALALRWFSARIIQNDAQVGLFGTALVVDIAVVCLASCLISRTVTTNAKVTIACIIFALILRTSGVIYVIASVDADLTASSLGNGGVISGSCGIVLGITHCTLNAWVYTNAKWHPRPSLTFPQQPRAV